MHAPSSDFSSSAGLPFGFGRGMNTSFTGLGSAQHNFNPQITTNQQMFGPIGGSGATQAHATGSRYSFGAANLSDGQIDIFGGSSATGNSPAGIPPVSSVPSGLSFTRRLVHSLLTSRRSCKSTKVKPSYHHPTETWILPPTSALARSIGSVLLKNIQSR
jgi:hypothetical protein